MHCHIIIILKCFGSMDNLLPFIFCVKFQSFISFNSSGHTSGFDREQDTLPDYLSDDSEMTVEDKAVKKPTEEDRKKSKTWFSAAANFLTNSFYW